LKPNIDLFRGSNGSLLDTSVNVLQPDNNIKNGNKTIANRFAALHFDFNPELPNVSSWLVFKIDVYFLDRYLMKVKKKLIIIEFDIAAE
jgi:hypothetical protein